jgi:ribosomal protein S27E
LAQPYGDVEGDRRRHRAPPPPSRRGIARYKKPKDRALRQLDRLFLSFLPDFTLVECEACGLEQANGHHPFSELGFVLGCLVCGHAYARSSANHEAAVGSLQLPSGLKVGAPM